MKFELNTGSMRELVGNPSWDSRIVQELEQIQERMGRGSESGMRVEQLEIRHVVVDGTHIACNHNKELLLTIRGI